MGFEVCGIIQLYKKVAKTWQTMSRFGPTKMGRILRTKDNVKWAEIEGTLSEKDKDLFEDCDFGLSLMCIEENEEYILRLIYFFKG